MLAYPTDYANENMLVGTEPNKSIIDNLFGTFHLLNSASLCRENNTVRPAPRAKRIPHVITYITDKEIGNHFVS